MNLLGLLVDKGALSSKERAAIEAELTKNRPLSDVLAEHNLSLCRRAC